MRTPSPLVEARRGLKRSRAVSPSEEPEHRATKAQRLVLAILF